MATNVRINYRGVGEMLCSPWMVAEMHRRAERVAERARVTAPHSSGQFAASFEVSSGIRQARTRRAYGRVTNTDPAARYIEFGTEDTPAHRTLGRALAAAKE